MMDDPISKDEVHNFIVATLAGTAPVQAWGETAYFYNPNNRLKRGTYFATLKEKDGDNDKASNLDRGGVWRLSMGVQVKTFESIFGGRPDRPAKGQAIDGVWDFTALDALTPHPVYGWMGWLAVCNPGETTWEKCKPLLVDAHSRAMTTFNKRTQNSTT